MRLFARAGAFVAALLIVAYGLLTTRGRSEVPWLIVISATAILLLVTFWPSIPRGTPQFDRAVIRCTVLFLVGFMVVAIQLVRLQIVDSAQILSRTGVASNGTVIANPRKAIEEAKTIRGRIFAAGGQTIAGTKVSPDGSWVRTYGDPSAAYLAGFYSPLLYGESGLERSYDAYLTGQKGGNPVTQWLNGVLHRTTHGYDLTLSIDLGLQQKAQQLLGNQRGAVIVMNAKTGAIMAMASAPTYDPSQLFAATGPNSNQEIATAQAYWAKISKQTDSPLLLRPTQGLYPPGSIFKTVTASAALETGSANPNTVYRDEGSLVIDGRVIPEQNRPNPNQVAYTLTQAYGWSLNVVFAQVGLQLGAQHLTQYAQNFGIGSQIPFDLPVATSQLDSSPGFLSSQNALADTSFGQGQLLVTPLQMALVADAVANNGQMMVPYLVQHINTYTGQTLQTTQPQVWKQPINAQTASEMRTMMIQSVQQGWAKAAAIPGYVVGGKTGTAESGTPQPHAWFIGFAGKQNPQYVVAVIIEHGGEGTTVALPIGRAMLQAALALPNP